MAPPVFHIETIDPDASPTEAAAVAVMTSLVNIGVDIPTPTEALQTAVATVTSTYMAVATKAPSGGGSAGGPGENNGDCSLLGSFALIVQAALGLLALSSLVFKRWRERPQRPLKIWFFDVSKQVFGSVLVHIANVFMSMLTSGRFSIKLEPAAVQNARRLLVRDEDGYTPNPCSFYLLNLAIDTTVGIPILIILLKVFTGLVAMTPVGQPPESIKSGNYGNPPNAWWWLKQSVIYFCGLFGMKICVLIFFLLLPWISRVGDWALRWTEGNEQLQIIFVMMLFPLIMNALQYYIIDSFIKQKENEHERIPEEDPDWATGQAGNPYDDDGLISDSDDDDDSRLIKGNSHALRQPKQSEDAEYDPAVDGDVPTVIGSSSSRRNDSGKLLPRDLYPKE